jgi:hypothetical protein
MEPPKRKKAQVAKFNLDDYETVESRLKKFWTQFPNGRIHTFLLHRDDRSFIVRTELYTNQDDMRPITTGMAEEIIGVGMVNTTSALENAESSSIGRALANFIFSGNKRPSRQEMEKVERYDKEPRKPLQIVRTFTPEQLARLEGILKLISETNDVENLRVVWNQEKDFLDIKVAGTTLKDALNKRVQELS